MQRTWIVSTAIVDKETSGSQSWYWDERWEINPRNTVQSNKMMTMGYFSPAKLFILPVKCLEMMLSLNGIVESREWKAEVELEVEREPPCLISIFKYLSPCDLTGQSKVNSLNCLTVFQSKFSLLIFPGTITIKTEYRKPFLLKQNKKLSIRGTKFYFAKKTSNNLNVFVLYRCVFHWLLSFFSWWDLYFFSLFKYKEEG